MSSGRHGFETKALTPPWFTASEAVFLSAYAVTMTRSRSGCMSRATVQSCTPVMPGMRWSVSSTSKDRRSSSSMASRGSPTLVMAKVSWKLSSKTTRLACSSST